MILEIAIGAVSVIFGMVITYFTFMRNRDKDVKKDAQETAMISAKLDHISSGVDSVRLDLKSNEHRVSEINDRVIRIDESVKSAHKRIDKIDKGCR